MFNLCGRGRSAAEEEEEQAREQARAVAREQRLQDSMNSAYEQLLAQDPSPPRSLVSILVCYPESTKYNAYRRREVGRYLQKSLEDRGVIGVLRADPEFHTHECRAMAVTLKDDGRYPRDSYEFQGHLHRRALDAINTKLVPCHPDHRIQYPFVTEGLMLALVRLQNPPHGRRSSRSMRFPYP